MALALLKSRDKLGWVVAFFIYAFFAAIYVPLFVLTLNVQHKGVDFQKAAGVITGQLLQAAQKDAKTVIDTSVYHTAGFVVDNLKSDSATDIQFNQIFITQYFGGIHAAIITQQTDDIQLLLAFAEAVTGPLVANFEPTLSMARAANLTDVLEAVRQQIAYVLRTETIEAVGTDEEFLTLINYIVLDESDEVN
eukprot:Awhi_evm1s12347